MKLYLFIVFAGTVAVATGNAVYVGAITGAVVWWVPIVLTVGTVAALFACDIIFAFVVKSLPRKWFDPRRRIFRASKCEARFYEFIRINKWKDKVPEVGKLVGYDKTKVGDLSSANLNMFLTETAYAEVIHYFCLLSSVIVPVVYFMLPLPQIQGFFWTIILPCAFVNFALNLPPIFIQRHNRPRLLRIYDLLLKKEERAAKDN